MTYHDLRPREYWENLLGGIESKSGQAKTMLPHMASRGAAREKIIREVLEKSTPKSFTVSSGFIGDGYPFLHPGFRELRLAVKQGKMTVEAIAKDCGVEPVMVKRCITDRFYPSRQCDVLVHTGEYAPVFSDDSLEVVRADTVRAVAEVKSELTKGQFRHVVEICMSARAPGNNRLSTWCFAYEGIRPRTLIKHVQDFRRHPKGWLDNDEVCKLLLPARGQDYQWLPDAIVVLDRNYVACRCNDAHSYYTVEFEPDSDRAGAFRFAMELYERRLTQNSSGMEACAFQEVLRECGAKRIRILSKEAEKDWR